MNWQQLKETIGDTARSIIASEKNLDGHNGLMTCPATQHKKGKTSVQWVSKGKKMNFFFYCHDCGQKYDIINLVMEKNATVKEQSRELHRLANVPFEEKSKPKKIEIIEPHSTSMDWNAQDYLDSRKISQATIDAYSVTSDKEFVYFNFFAYDDGIRKLVKVKGRRVGDVANGYDKYKPIKGGTNVLYGQQSHKGQQNLIITEGESDALILHSLLVELKWDEHFCVCSLPSGSSSFAWVENDLEYLATFDKILLVPDNDTAGKKMLEKAAEALGNYRLMYYDLNDFGSSYNDIGEYLQDNRDGKFLSMFKSVPLDGCVSLSDTALVKIQSGIASGFLTHDHNDSGLKAGRVTLLTGFRGTGKTTVARQMLMCACTQNANVFGFFGESSNGEEVGKFARLTCQKGEIISEDNGFGRTLYHPNDEALSRFRERYGKKIIMYDQSSISVSGNIFDDIFKKMQAACRQRHCKVFMLDNMMMMCQAKNGNILEEQKRITQTLKEFANDNGVHVILIAHPKKGEGLQSVSGAAEQENMVDTILYYVRVNDGLTGVAAERMGFDSKTGKRVSACLYNRKVRDEGTDLPVFLEWRPVSGSVVELNSNTKLQKIASEYAGKGWWTIPAKGFEEEDQPEPIQHWEKS